MNDFARGAERAIDAGFEWVEMHYAHGFLGASFLSPVANTRDDEYGGSMEDRSRLLVEALDAVRAVWPERLPLTARIGAVDYGMETHSVEDSIWLVRALREHGLDLIDISMGMNTDAGEVPWTDRGFRMPMAVRIRAETGVSIAVNRYDVLPKQYSDALQRSRDTVNCSGFGPTSGPARALRDA